MWPRSCTAASARVGEPARRRPCYAARQFVEPLGVDAADSLDAAAILLRCDARRELEARMVYEGRCHCGAVRYEVDGPIDGVELCNCSICTRSAYLHWYVAPGRFRLLTPRDAFATYQFGTRVAKHHFCRTCGISAFRRARSNPDEIDVNVRCLEGVDLEAIPVKRFDGRNWEAQMERR